MDAERSLNSYNIAFLEALYEQYEQDPASVDPNWRALIEYEQQRGPTVSPPRNGATTHPPNGHSQAAYAGNGLTADAEQVALQNDVDRLIENYRLVGHLRAQIDPLGRERAVQTEGLDLEHFGLRPEHLDRSFYGGRLFDHQNVPLRDILAKLQATYCRRIGVEYWHLNDVQMRQWMREAMEPCENEVIPSKSEQLRLLRSLASADESDKFLHNKFIGAKRFSVSGAESVIVLLETLLEEAGDHDVNEVVVGMAHRGRLSVMMNVMGQSATEIFSRFAGGDPYANIGSGDVKYHLGCYRNLVTASGKEMYVALAFNPSHLEAISPVIAGRARASQDRREPDQRNTVLGVTLHGDSAVIGQGVYAETLNLSRLDGYANEGTVRVIINNQVGFTTNPSDARSTIYPSAVADMLNVPVFHVNGDDPEAAAFVARLAVAFRQRFKRDVIIDLVCYRRFGHNEGDEPTFTQPEMYRRIKQHPSVRAQYEQRLLERGTVSRADLDALTQELKNHFEASLDEVRKSTPTNGRSPMHGRWTEYKGGLDSEVPEVDTSISLETLESVAAAATAVPEGFDLHSKLKRFVKEMTSMFAGEAPLSWAACEHMAYGSLLFEGHNVRLSGQDVIRGTFTHRHLGWTDSTTGERHLPLQVMPGAKGQLTAFNSPLSEFAVVGFEFGYSLAAPDTLIIWEAQFGDFVNGAQVILDQFISSSEDKWNRISGLVLFLPHGYEGQGPEHSSARLERFLQMCAEDNMQVCNLTSPAQVFHVLRRQIHRQWRKPLIIMTPKSLLRTRESFSDRSELLEGSFHRLIDDTTAEPAKVERVMACSGKIYYDLAAARAQRDSSNIALIRVEQLYPFPAAELQAALSRYPNARDLVWVQEEPRNMGGWTFVEPHINRVLPDSVSLSFAGRAESASPATGSGASHKLEQEMLVGEAFGDPPQHPTSD